MREDPPARGARERCKAQEEACVTTRFHCQIEATDFLKGWNLAASDDGQCAFWSAQNVFGDRQQVVRLRFNADQLVQ